MTEHIPILANMSSASRSTVSINPYQLVRVDPASLKQDTAVLVSISELLETAMDVPITAHLYEFFCGHGVQRHADGTPNVDSCENKLRMLANNRIRAAGIVGCAIMQPKASFRKKVIIADVLLSFAVLTKSSEKLFVASKTPNLSVSLLERELITYDPRLVALVEEEPR